MPFSRILALLAAFFLALPSLAASLADRSPFYQGHWWDPNRPGTGFEIFNAAGTVQVIWYAFDENSRPIWYTAQGSVASLGRVAWPLLRHGWVNGRKAEAMQVGGLRLNVKSAESAEVVWEFGTRQATIAIEPFIVSGIVKEVDHSGSWFDPANSGWGIGLTEQGDVLGGVLFTYDASGSPTWYAGFERNSTGSAEVYAASGSCPWCAYRATTTVRAGRLSFNFASETRLALGAQLDAPTAAGINADGAQLAMLSRPASWRPADRQLASFETDAPLRDFLVAGLMNTPAANLAIIVPSPAPAVAFSTTNLQESGVDEADLVKSNGRQVYAYAYNAGTTLPTIRVVRTPDEGASLEVVGTAALASGTATPMGNAGLFIDGQTLVSVTGTQPYYYYTPVYGTPTSWRRGTTYVEVMSLANPDVPVTRWRVEIEGHVVASRRIGQRLYVVSRFLPEIPGFAYGSTYAPQVTANQQLLAATPLVSLLPKVRIDGGAPQGAVTAAAVFAPPQGMRSPQAEMTLVTAVDLRQPAIAQTLAIVGSVETVYASMSNLYLATTRYNIRTSYGALAPIEPGYALTDIHQVVLGADAMRVAGSASVEGHLGSDMDLASFRFGEDAGRLRVVTSSGTLWGAGSKNRLTILEPSAVAPGLLKTVSWLPNTRRPESLGKPGELLYGTRFVGDRLYAVTFKKVDPLYVVDLADAADPRIAGALEIPGFSEYLHPLPNGLLLGFGKDAKPANAVGDAQFAWYQGLQLTLFDVSNAGLPREIQRLLIGKRGSDSALLQHHHAFSALTKGDGSLSIAIPASIHDGTPLNYGMGDWGYMYPWQQSGLLRFEMRGTTPADARLAQLPMLVTHSAANPPSYSGDPGRDGGRSILFRSGTLYYGKGQFWRQDSAGNGFGPY